ncbi:MAG: hypothetical protein IJ220_08485 [Clostridia bacterium]|nr:hypothetical protein [Clostridia bacterium]
MDRFFVVTHAEGVSKYFRFVWGDVEKYNAVILNYPVEFPNSVLKTLFRIHNSSDINNIIRLPFKNIWSKYYSLKPSMLDPKDRNFIIFDNTIKYSKKYLTMLKKNYNCIIVNILQDTLKVYKCAYDKESLDRYISDKCVDRLFSFDFKDCENYGLEYYMLYSYPFSNVKSKKSDSILYVGSCKTQTRLNTLHAVYEKLNDRCSLDFNIVGVSNKNMLYPDGIHYNKMLSYDKVVKKIEQNNVLLDIVNEGQSGISLRCCEAICFNKKLLTNNPNIKKSSFYDKRYMFYFKDVSDIDVDWIKADIKIDYHYNNEFHPSNLFKLLSETS